MNVSPSTTTSCVSPLPIQLSCAERTKCEATRQTVFMITHDVDEALLLADRILLMSNGPAARIAEIVDNTLGRPRSRNEVHHDPRYYGMRNHPVDFLINRSKRYQSGKIVNLKIGGVAA